MTSRLYVFAPAPAPNGLATEHLLAGRIDWSEGVGDFRYAREWLEGGYALDPINLPLVDGPQIAHVNGGIPGVLTDAGPDAWGRKLIELERGAAAGTPIDVLRLSNGCGTGGLRFSQSRTRPAPLRALLARASLDELEASARAIDAGAPIPREELERVFEVGSPLGGARPKVSVTSEDREWLAKFQRPADDLDNPRLEAACLTLARDAGLDVPDHRLVDLNGRSALLVARFDRPATGSVHYLSLNSLLSLERINAQEVVAPRGACTYGGLAARCRRIGVENAGSILFQRMLFNIRVGNTDDHLRNHGLLYDGRWRHAPSFDLVAVGGSVQAIGVGTSGRQATITNAFSDIERFGVGSEEAHAMDDAILASLSRAEEVLSRAGLPPADVERVRRRFHLDA